MSTPEDDLASDGGTGMLPEAVVTSTRPPPITTSYSPDLTAPNLDPIDSPTLPGIQAPAPGTQQYGRKFSLIVADDTGQGIELGTLRCVFRITRGDFQNPNTADIRVYNLSTETANDLAGTDSEFTQLAIQAGYPGNFGLIFQGLITQARIGRENQTDSYVDFTAADGDEAYNYGMVAASIAAGPNTADNGLKAILAGIQAASSTQPITQGNKPTLPTQGNPRGRVHFGPARDEMRDLANNNDCLWSIQNGKLTLIPQTSYLAGDIIQVSPQTGLIGTPEQTQNGLSVSVLLNPSIKIGQAIQLTNTTINQLRYSLDIGSVASNELLQKGAAKINGAGLYYVMVANHSGDTRGNNWQTDMVCLAIDATVPASDYHLGNTTVSAGAIRRW